MFLLYFNIFITLQHYLFPDVLMNVVDKPTIHTRAGIAPIVGLGISLYTLHRNKHKKYARVAEGDFSCWSTFRCTKQK